MIVEKEILYLFVILIRGFQHFFYLVYYLFYIEAKSINYKSVFIEYKVFFCFMRYRCFCKKYPKQMLRPQFVHCQFSQN